MKLRSIHESLILELFDDLGLPDDVHSDISNFQYKYSFTESVTLNTYIVTIYQGKTSDETISTIPNIQNPDEYWEIALRSDAGHGLTNRGNFGYVYKRLLACIKDFMDRKKPRILSFSGYEPGMNLVYNKFLDKFLKSKEDPNFYFHKYVGDLYVSQALIDAVPEKWQRIITEKIKGSSANFSDALTDIKKDGINKKQVKANEQRIRLIEQNMHYFYQNDANVYYAKSCNYSFDDTSSGQDNSSLMCQTVLFTIQDGKLSQKNVKVPADKLLRTNKLKDFEDFQNLTKIGFDHQSISDILEFAIGDGSRLYDRYQKYYYHLNPDNFIDDNPSMWDD